MSNSATALRRWAGSFCLAVASGMLIWGHTVLQDQLHGVWFDVYWVTFLLFTGAAIAIGSVDVIAVRREVRQERANLLERTLSEMELRSGNERRTGQEPP